VSETFPEHRALENMKFHENQLPKKNPAEAGFRKH
jgi:hypothetical protein